MSKHEGGAENSSNTPESKGTLREVNGEAWPDVLPEWRIPDLNFMHITLLPEVVKAAQPVSGAFLAKTLREYSKQVEDLADASAATEHLACYLLGISKTPPYNRGWEGLIELAFWTVRNAIWTWNSPIDQGGKPLRDCEIEYWTPPNPKLKLEEGALGLKMHPLILLRVEKTLIESPEWFLKTRSLPFPFYPKDTEWVKVAKGILSEYFRNIIFDETRSIHDPSSVHPAVSRFLSGGRRTKKGILIRDRHGETPGRLIHALINIIKDKFGTLSGDAFIPWSRTLPGLIPGSGWPDDWRKSREMT